MTALRDEFGGVVQAPCGFGKTVIGLKVAEAMGVRTMLLVDKRGKVVNRSVHANELEGELEKILR